ncbi:uncharacterized protein LOC141914821 [Tubulanus polymorphus]|uniref:uncharacterized protein LOC141914821 n=1 Tax=Tubulanus polymorphus TaxID=672921 RepID=UPI003DA6C6C1
MDDLALKTMKYADLQKLAKKLGVRANMKADHLIKAIMEAQTIHTSDDDIEQEDAVGLEENVVKKDAKELNGKELARVNSRKNRRGRNKSKAEDSIDDTNSENVMTSDESEKEEKPIVRRGRKNRSKRNESKAEVRDKDVGLVTSDESDTDQKQLKNSQRKYFNDAEKKITRNKTSDSVETAGNSDCEMQYKPEHAEQLESDSSKIKTPESSASNSCSDMEASLQKSSEKDKQITNSSADMKITERKGRSSKRCDVSPINESTSLRRGRSGSRKAGDVNAKNVSKQKKSASPIDKRRKSAISIVENILSRRGHSNDGVRSADNTNLKTPLNKTSSSQRRSVILSACVSRQRLSIMGRRSKSKTLICRVRGETTDEQLDITAKSEKVEETASKSKDETIEEKTRETVPDVPVTEDIVMAMKGTENEMKETLMAALEKKVQIMNKAEQPTTDKSNIPRFSAFLAKNRERQKKPVTPGNKDWAKIHQRNFNKMESIDTYLANKRKRTESQTQSLKRAKIVTESARATVERLKNFKTPTHVNKKIPKIVKPVSVSRSATCFTNQNLTMNATFGSTVSKKTGNSVVGSARKSTTAPITPFQFSATPNAAVNKTVGSTSKAFDLKASLSKPLTWKPYTGKLKPLDVNSSVPSKAKNRLDLVKKKPTLKTREERRQDHVSMRASKKNDSLMKRRGMVS